MHHKLSPLGLAARTLAVSATLTAAATAHAQGNSAPTEQRIEITGSAIKRTASAETSLPVTIIRADELRATGVTTVEEAVGRIVASQSLNGGSNAIGSSTGGAAYASLRALAPNKTLILLNGRRVAPFAFQVAGTDLNAIPFAAVERIEVLRDGASAIYGTDAIGGVINFITRSSVTGVTLSAEAAQPKLTGGSSTRQSVTAGFGNLQERGFNLWASFDRQDRNRVRALDRPFARTGIIPSRGVSGTSPTTFPGNFTQSSTGVSGNPSAPNCDPPYSVPSPTNRSVCVFDFTATIDIVPEVEIDTGLLRGTLKLGESATLSVEHTQAKTQTIARVAPDPVSGIVIAPDNPFYPRTYPGLDTSRPVTAGWRMVPAGPRTNQSDSEASRTVVDLSGLWGPWDYKFGLFATTSKAKDGAIDGYVDAGFIRSEVAAGRLNPFAAPNAEQLAIIERAKRRGEFANAEGKVKGVDARVSRELFELPGGPMAASLGLELRQEDYRTDTNDAFVLAVPSAGRSPDHVLADRSVKAATLETLLPLSKSLELQLALRADDYEGVGSSVNPKVAVRFAPTRSLTLRGSANTGFRAPTLDEQFGPKTFTFAATSSNDPLLCPGGVADRAAGGVQSRDCGRQAQVQTGGNTELKPEKSRTFSMGLSFDVTPAFNVTADYWNIDIKDLIANFPNESIIAQPARYATRIVRCNALPADVQALLDRCQADGRDSRAIGYLVALTDNLGRVKTDGVDISASYQLRTASAGSFSFTYDGTWVHSYRTQNSPEEALKENVGEYVDSAPVIRWQHNLGALWRIANLSTRLGLRHKSGYVDQNSPSIVTGGAAFYGNVASYTLVDASFSVAAPFDLKGMNFTVGVRNLFDRDPPFSNQANRTQRGYEPRLTDPLGRTVFVRASYAFGG
jgi:iron complex outermembrane receptor protein